MTIKEIANLAGVSASTVSKIMNNKDDSISAETREHVLKIAKEYNYTPYASILQPNTKSLVLGVIFHNACDFNMTLNGILEIASAMGYSVLIRESGGDLTSELKNITALIKLHVDGVIWEPVDPQSFEYGSYFQSAQIPYTIINSSIENSVNVDYEKMGYLATEELILKNHVDIACLLGRGTRTEAFFNGYKHALFKHHLPFNPYFIFKDFDGMQINKIATHAFSGIVVSHYAQALKLYEAVHTLHYEIPYDLSVVSLKDDTRVNTDYPPISSFTIPHFEFGKRLAASFIKKIEKTENSSPDLNINTGLNHRYSIDIPYSLRAKKVISLGSINIDNYLNFESLPRTGKTVTSSNSSVFPGGKSINQAAGVARLGHNAAVIGRVGNDADADIIYASAKNFQIDTLGITRTHGCKTGQAYIFVQKNGDSMISIMSGANNLVDAKDVLSNERLFVNASYCLMQTEIPLPAIEKACEIAHKYNVKTVLKPSAVSELPEHLLRMIDMIVPNLDELNEICPKGGNLEEKAEFLLNCGIGTVIVTLGANGSYVRTDIHNCYLPAADFTSVDNTGAGDAFISALVAYLLHGYDLIPSVKIATYAAGVSITRQGIAPSLTDRNTLEALIRQKEPDLLR